MVKRPGRTPDASKFALCPTWRQAAKGCRKISGEHRDLLNRKAVEREDGVRCLRDLRWVRA